MSKTVLFQTIQFTISTEFSSVWPKDRTLSSAVTLCLSRPVSNGNKRIPFIPQSSSITGASPSDCLVSYPGQSLRECYPSAEMQSVYSTVSGEWVTVHSLVESYPSVEMQSVYSAAPHSQLTGPARSKQQAASIKRHVVLHICRRYSQHLLTPGDSLNSLLG